MCVTFGIVHFPRNYHRQISFQLMAPIFDFAEVLVLVSATTFSHRRGAAVFRDIYSIVT